MQGVIEFSADEFPPIEMPCLRCGAPSLLRFAGPCPTCVAELRAAMAGEARELEGGDYVPKMNVTPNAVALKDS